MAFLMTWNRWAAIAAFATTGAIAIAACSSDDEGAGDSADAGAGDASTDDADPCNSYKRGAACTLSPSKICFAQCATGGCFCENGLWTCRTDTSCFQETGPIDDVLVPPVDDAATDDGATDDGATDAAGDASADGDASTEASTDAEPGDAADASADAPDGG